MPPTGAAPGTRWVEGTTEQEFFNGAENGDFGEGLSSQCQCVSSTLRCLQQRGETGLQ